MLFLLYLFWIILELAEGFFILNGISGWRNGLLFLACHGGCVLVSYLIFSALMESDELLREKVVTKGFSFFLIAVATIPLVGPITLLLHVLFLRFYPVYPLRAELYTSVNSDVMWVVQKGFEKRTVPVTESLLTSGLDRENSLKMLTVLGEMEWAATKSGILKYLIRLSPFQNVVLMAIDMLSQKMDAILSEISQLEASGDLGRANLRQLANLYHEICYLDLCEPVMKSFYIEKACEYATRAYQEGEAEDDALLAVKYLLEADQVDAAKTIHDDVENRGGYDNNKWIPYQFEISVRLDNKDLFDELYIFIELGGGVFIPKRVKAAAKAWKKVLTSACL